MRRDVTDVAAPTFEACLVTAVATLVDYFCRGWSGSTGFRKRRARRGAKGFALKARRSTL